MKFNKIILAASLSAVMLSAGVSAGNSGHSHDNDSTAQGSEQMSHGSMSHGSMAQGQMQQGGMAHDAMASNMTQSQMFMEKKDIDGYTVSFHVMADEGMGHGGTHNLMIKVEQQGVAITDLKVNSKVIYPDGTEESKSLMAMGEWQMAGYDLKASGKYQLMVLFKTADGKKHFGGLYYAR